MSASNPPPPAPIPAETVQSPSPIPPAFEKRTRKSWLWVVGGIGLVVVLIVGGVWVRNALRTESTDDAFVNGHVTFVAPRVGGQVARVLVDDNNRVRKGDILVQLDPEPYRVQLKIAESAVTTAQADLEYAQAQARGTVGQARSLRFALEHAMEDVDNQIALLRAKVAGLNAAKATLDRAQADYNRVEPLAKTGAVTTDEVDRRHQVLLVSQAEVEQAVQGVYQVRVALGLPPKPTSGDDLTQVPPDLAQTFSTVRQAQGSLIQAISQLGVTDSFDKSPRQMIADFYKRDPSGDIDKIYAQLLAKAPAVIEARAKLDQAQRNLDQAKLNLRYCDVVSEIDGVVTRRNVNPGNNVVSGQSLMAVRSISEIWVDANFKETQLSNLRIGLPVDLDVDMYGSRHHFEGRISGLTMGTGSTLALLPPENATGNFVKVVQRVPVRVEIVNYDPETTPLFVGTSVNVTVRFTEQPAGDNAGKILQPVMAGQPATEPAQ